MDKESLEQLKKENRRTVWIMFATLALTIVKLVIDLVRIAEN